MSGPKIQQYTHTSTCDAEYIYIVVDSDHRGEETCEEFISKTLYVSNTSLHLGGIICTILGFFTGKNLIYFTYYYSKSTIV